MTAGKHQLFEKNASKSFDKTSNLKTSSNRNKENSSSKSEESKDKFVKFQVWCPQEQETQVIDIINNRASHLTLGEDLKVYPEDKPIKLHFFQEKHDVTSGVVTVKIAKKHAQIFRGYRFSLSVNEEGLKKKNKSNFLVFEEKPSQGNLSLSFCYENFDLNQEVYTSDILETFRRQKVQFDYAKYYKYEQNGTFLFIELFFKDENAIRRALTLKSAKFACQTQGCPHSKQGILN